MDLDAMRLLLVLKAFKQDKGKLPDSLAELVPEYIEEIPADPFDGKPIRYSADKKRIYSVGKDLIDSGGSEEISDPNRRASYRGGDVLTLRRYAKDIVYRIEF